MEIQWVKSQGETIPGSEVEAVELGSPVSIVRMKSGHLLYTTAPVAVRYLPEDKES